ncbi:MAG: S-methyl-5-thioribose-1-phosphate isomerase [Clostridiales bacterium]|nr:S-methyl-5-thioribose-1-phosphate isomerase [Clostridiales bacterium]
MKETKFDGSVVALPDTVALDDERSALVIIDQTQLPRRLELIALTEQVQIFEAIRSLRVRGAPAIGVSAAIGYYLAAKQLVNCGDKSIFFQKIGAAREYLASSRPTAVNLFWALDRMQNVTDTHSNLSVVEIVTKLHEECLKIRDEDIESCRRIGENGLKILGRSRNILTHCNAGQLAAVRYGTALAPIHLGHERGIDFKVYCDETRPLLQGMRLSAFELAANGIDTTVICDNMVSSLMSQGKIDAVIVGADRIAANGDTANKIGTSGVAILAKYYNIPFYVAAPKSTFDMSTPTGKDIIIEQRDPSEIGELWFSEPLSPDGAKTYNPAFDVTPHELITGFITD